MKIRYLHGRREAEVGYVTVQQPLPGDITIVQEHGPGRVSEVRMTADEALQVSAVLTMWALDRKGQNGGTNPPGETPA